MVEQGGAGSVQSGGGKSFMTVAAAFLIAVFIAATVGISAWSLSAGDPWSGSDIQGNAEPQYEVQDLDVMASAVVTVATGIGSASGPAENAGPSQSQSPSVSPSSSSQGGPTGSTSSATCSRCGGSGTISVPIYTPKWVSCSNCGGIGMIQGFDGWMTCPVCGGARGTTTEVVSESRVTCPDCGGTGHVN